jgi:hypothetical protein
MPQDKKYVRLISDILDVFDLIDELNDYEFLLDDSIHESGDSINPNIKKITLLLSLYKEKIEKTLPVAKDILSKHINA